LSVRKGERSGRELGRALLREGPHGVVVDLPRQLLVGQGVAGAAAVDLDAGLEFLARAGGHAQDGGEGVRERRAAALVLDAAHQGGQGDAAGVTGGVGEVLVGHAEAAAEQRRGDRVGAAERRVVPGGRPCLGLGWLGDRAQDRLGDAQLDRCDVGGGEPLRSRRAASTPAWVKWLHGYGLKTTRGSSQSVPRPRTTASGWARSPQNACRNPKRPSSTVGGPVSPCRARSAAATPQRAAQPQWTRLTVPPVRLASSRPAPMLAAMPAAEAIPASSCPCSIATATAAPTAPQMDVACRPRSKNTELRSSSS